MSGVNILGIDPGKQGGLAIITQDSVLLEPMPLHAGEIDIPELHRLVRDHANDIRVAYIERVHAMPKNGKLALFSLGKSYGIVLAIVLMNGIPLVEVRPQEWQRVMHEGVAVHRRQAGLTTKDVSRIAFARLFPGVDARKTAKCSVQHDGLVEAALIAEYGRRQCVTFNL